MRERAERLLMSSCVEVLSLKKFVVIFDIAMQTYELDTKYETLSTSDSPYLPNGGQSASGGVLQKGASVSCLRRGFGGRSAGKICR